MSHETLDALERAIRDHTYQPTNFDETMLVLIARVRALEALCRVTDDELRDYGWDSEHPLRKELKAAGSGEAVEGGK